MASAFVRWSFVALALVAGFGAWAAAGIEVSASEIRFFVRQSSGLFEIKDSTAGRFVPRLTNEYIHVEGVGPIRVVGYTDRASRGETVVNQVRGTGRATIWVTRTTNGQVINIVPPFLTNLPRVVPILVPVNTDFDNIVGYVKIGGHTISRRLPVGTRP